MQNFTFSPDNVTLNSTKKWQKNVETDFYKKSQEGVKQIQLLIGKALENLY